jgi:hypothetical protein
MRNYERLLAKNQTLMSLVTTVLTDLQGLSHAVQMVLNTFS